MNLLEEAISDEKFERNIKIFRKILYTSIILGIGLVSYFSITGYFYQQTYHYNRKITIDILNNSVELDKLKNDSKINYIAKFKFISNFITKSAETLDDSSDVDINNINTTQFANDVNRVKAQFANKIDPEFRLNVIDILEDLKSSSNRFVSELALDYLGKLILDQPRNFTHDYALKYFTEIGQIIDTKLDVKLDNVSRGNVSRGFDEVSNLILLKGIWLKKINIEEFFNFYVKVKKFFDQTKSKNQMSINQMLILDLIAEKNKIHNTNLLTFFGK